MPIFLRTHPRLVLLCLYLVFLLLVELVLRLVWGDELIPDAAPAIIANPQVHHDYRPGVRFTTRPFPGDTFTPVENRINAFAPAAPNHNPKTTRASCYWATPSCKPMRSPTNRVSHICSTCTLPTIWTSSRTAWSVGRRPPNSLGSTTRASPSPPTLSYYFCASTTSTVAKYSTKPTPIYRAQAVYQDRIPVTYELPQQSRSGVLLENIALARLLYRTL